FTCVHTCTLFCQPLQEYLCYKYTKTSSEVYRQNVAAIQRRTTELLADYNPPKMGQEPDLNDL
ncbi:hypothetical protein OESDEN_14906, partial [Oesophagostomum dentatum]